MKNKEITVIGLNLTAQSIYMHMDKSFPSDKESYYKVMEQFDIPEKRAKQVIEKFEQLALDVERIVGF